MSTVTVVRYVTRPDAADENQRLVENVYAELRRSAPSGFRYATMRLADGVSFVHVAFADDGSNPLPQTAAFAEFVREIGARCVEPPVASNATVVGSYRFLDA